MSVTLMGLCWRIEWPSHNMLLVALKLADCANDEGENIYPSVGRVSRETKLGESTIRREIAAMEECGLLEVVQEASGNKWNRSTTIRRFDTEKLRALAETETRRGVYKPSQLVIKQVDTGETKVDKKGRAKAVLAWTTLWRQKPEQAIPDEDKQPNPPLLHTVEGQENATPPQHGEAGSETTPPARGGAPESAAPPQEGARPSTPGALPLHTVEPNHKRTTMEPSPPSPRKRGAKRGRDSLFEEIIEDLRAAGQPAHVLDTFITPVINSLTVRHPSPRGLFEQTCKLLGHYPLKLLELAARQMILDRKVWCSAKDVTEPVRRALPMAKQWRIAPDMPEHWAAWKAHHLAGKGRGPTWVHYCEGQGYFPELTEWPPGHFRDAETPSATPLEEIAA